MKLIFTPSSIFAFLVAVLFGLTIQASVAQTSQTSQTADEPKAKIASLVLEGTTLDKKSFQLNKLKGKVTLVMFWSTECPVCRDKMPELRENMKGWADKPFELVLVSADKSMKDVDDYFKYLSQIVPSKQRFTHLWTGSPTYKDNIGAKQIQLKQLPVTYLINKEGKVVAVYNGRIPTEIWDDIAELL
jgi:cytochrome oxidase Cu insertion factor (SCO1/SenC/PrrC family)